MRFLSCAFILLSAIVFSQNSYQAHYEYTNVGLSSKIEVINIFNTNESLSRFIDVDKDDLIQDDYGDVSFTVSLNDSIGDQYYHNKSELIFRDAVINEQKEFVIVDDSIPNFNWGVTKKTKQIGSYQCVLATGSYRGRVYNAWFTPEVVNQFGPWKFRGLGGMIVHISSSDGNIQFALKKIKKTNQKIQPPTHGRKVDLANYIQQKENVVKRFNERIRSKLPRGAKITINSVENYNLEIEY